MTSPSTCLVVYDADAVLELEVVKGKSDRKAVFTAVDKLRMLGPKLVPPHMKPLKGEGGLMELRPRQGKSAVRAIYRRTSETDYVILAFAVKADKADFDQAVVAARERSSRYGP